MPERRSLFTCFVIWMNKSFRFNERKDNDAGRFVKVVAGVICKGIALRQPYRQYGW